MKPQGYEKCRLEIENAILKEPVEYPNFTVYFDRDKLDNIKNKFGKYVFDIAYEDASKELESAYAESSKIKELLDGMSEDEFDNVLYECGIENM